MKIIELVNNPNYKPESSHIVRYGRTFTSPYCSQAFLLEDSPMAEYGFCECGCGEKTNLAPQTCTSKGWVKGEPRRFILGHSNRGELHGNWKGGQWKQGNYMMVKVTNGYKKEHRLIAEKVLGKPLPPEAVVHHYNGYDSEHKAQLVICENQAYHLLLHRRERALKDCGHANWRKCHHCHEHDKAENLYINSNNGAVFHRSCRAKYQRTLRKEKVTWKKKR